MNPPRQPRGNNNGRGLSSLRTINVSFSNGLPAPTPPRKKNTSFSSPRKAAAEPRQPSPTAFVPIEERDMFTFQFKDLHQFDLGSSSHLDSVIDRSPRSARSSPRVAKTRVVGATGTVGVRKVPTRPRNGVGASPLVRARHQGESDSSNASKLSPLRHLVATAAPPGATPSAGAGSKASRDAAAAAAAPEGEKGADVMTAQDISQMLLSLRTGEDAIAFFARVGTESNVKFLHLKRPDRGSGSGSGGGTAFRPYDLQVALTGRIADLEFPPLPHAMLRGEYFTMSAAGVVHISPSQPSEFIPLAEWMRQSTIFNVLSNIRFFKHYLLFKLFHRWRQNVRYSLYCQLRRRLSSSLFLAKPSFFGAVMDVNQVTASLKRVTLLDLHSNSKANSTSDYTQFAELQTAARADALKQFERSVEEVQGVLEGVCRRVRERATDPERSWMDAAQSRSAQRIKSMARLKEEEARRLSRQRSAITEVRMLKDLVRLTDYMTVGALYSHALTTTNAFLTELARPRKQGLFDTSVRFSEGVPEGEGGGGGMGLPGMGLGERSGDIVFHPRCADILGMTQQLTSGIVDTVNSVTRLLFLRPFNRIVADHVRDPPKVAALVRGDAQYQATLQRIDDKVRGDFVLLREYGRTFEAVRPVYEFERAWDFGAYSAEEHSLSTIRADIYRVQAQERDLEKMRVTQTVGIMMVESRKLRLSLMPSVSAIMDQMKELLKQLASKKCAQQVELYRERMLVLEQRPQQLREFALHVALLNELGEASKQLGRDTGEVEEKYRVLKELGVRVGHEDLARLDDLREAREAHDAEAAVARSFTRDKMVEMTSTLDTNIARLNEQLQQHKAHLQQGVFVNGKAEPRQVLPELSLVKGRLDKLEELSVTYSGYQQLFHIPEYDYVALKATLALYHSKLEMWQCLHDFAHKSEYWMSEDFLSIDTKQLEVEVAEFSRTAFKLHATVSDSVSLRLKTVVGDFRALVPCITQLGNRALKERHWEQVFKALAQPWLPGAMFTLEQLASYGVFQRRLLVADISAAATGEAKLAAQLARIQKGWAEREFTLAAHHGGGADSTVLRRLDSLFLQLDEDQTVLQAMAASQHILPIRASVAAWSSKLATLADTLEEWSGVQRSWVFLDHIFSSADIHAQLPGEADAFHVVDKQWRSIMARTRDAPVAVRAVEKQSGGGAAPALSASTLNLGSSSGGGSGGSGSIPGDGALDDSLLRQLQHMGSALDSILRRVEDYLDTKRAAFPRFYFLSNDELLEILAQTRDPQAVQPHLIKCFEGLNSVTFRDTLGAAEMVAMSSADGESVAFSKPVMAAGLAEDWLSALEVTMVDSLKRITHEALRAHAVASKESEEQRVQAAAAAGANGDGGDGDAEEAVLPEEEGWEEEEGVAVEDPLDAWLFAFPAQVVTLCDALTWTHRVTRAIDAVGSGEDRGGLHSARRQSEGDIARLVGTLRRLQGDASRPQMLLLGAMLVQSVHARDTVGGLAARGVRSVRDFEWVKQLRYHWESSSEGGSGEAECVVRQALAQFDYGFEYLGNSSRLVMTTLTDRIYLTLTGALRMNLGGAPAGPAGTGKTETIKDLAKALARHCLVFNCSDGLRTDMMARFFSGMASSGAWSCFDEFNRIDVGVLSVVAQQISSIQQAIVGQCEEMEFQGFRIELDPNFGVFITMNPGYAGRSELPDNLKALFRPVAVMAPQLSMICEIVLLTQGFATASALAPKVALMYRLCAQQLSQQTHYDWGLRALKTVLLLAGALKRAADAEAEAAGELGAEVGAGEVGVVLRAIHDSNMPKLLPADQPLFLAMFRDLFPEEELPSRGSLLLRAAVERELGLRGLDAPPALVEKVVQLHATQTVRHGVMVVGQPCSGKSTAVDALASSLGALFNAGRGSGGGGDPMFLPVRRYRVNPKAVPLEALLGAFHTEAREWKDGLLAVVMRAACRVQTMEVEVEAELEEEERKDAEEDEAAAQAKAAAAADGDGDGDGGGTGDGGDGIATADAAGADDGGVAAEGSLTLPGGSVTVESSSVLLSGPSRSWVILDGPVDTLWVESLNTVLDDTKTLCLANGERIRLPDAVHVMFEVQHLEAASPATVSRCGMVYMPHKLLSLSSLLVAWQAHTRAPSSKVARLMELITTHVPPAIAFVTHEMAAAAGSGGDGSSGVGGGGASVSGTALCLSMLRLLDALLCPQRGATEEHPQLERLVGMTFSFALTWSIGAVLPDALRPAFNQFASGRLLPLLHGVQTAGGVDLFSFFVASPDTAEVRLMPWLHSMERYSYDPSLPFHAVLVPTEESSRTCFLLDTLLPAGRHVLLTGESGVGKSKMVRAFLKRNALRSAAPSPTPAPAVSAAQGSGDGEDAAATGGGGSGSGSAASGGEEVMMPWVQLAFSHHSSPAQLQSFLEGNLERKRRTMLAPHGSVGMVVFIDDVAMPARDQFGTRGVCQLLRQVIDQSGFYDRRRLFFKAVSGVTFLACASAAAGGSGGSGGAGGRAPLAPRLSRHFHTLWQSTLAEDSMMRVFGNVLSGFLLQEFPELEGMATAVVAASLQLYSAVRAQLRPTPSRAHYSFNLRDMSALLQGCLQTCHPSLTRRGDWLRLWVHEACRVFRDRLVDDGDRQWLDRQLLQALSRHLGVEWQASDLSSILFGDFFARDGKAYRELRNRPSLDALLCDYLEEYNLSRPRPMDLVFFDDAVAHLCRIARALRRPRGHALLVGVGGSGRRSLGRLAAFICDFDQRSISVGGDYGVSEWRDDLKQAMMAAGKGGIPVVLLLSDSQMVDEQFLEDVNCVLSCGHVQGLYNAEDMAAITASVRPMLRTLGKEETPRSLMEHYVQTVRDHLHFIITASPIGPAFRRRVRQFPALVNNCVIDWWSPWPEAALMSVANRYLENSAHLPGIAPHAQALCRMCVHVHSCTTAATLPFAAELRRRVYTTPTSYLELLRLYLHTLRQHSARVEGKIARYETGFLRLQSANAEVSRLQTELTQMQPGLKRAARDTEELLQELQGEQREVERARAVAGSDEAECAQLASAVEAIKLECEKDLNQALPAYRKALRALDRIDKAAITEMKSYTSPPQLVKTVMEAVCILLGRPTTWEDAKKLLGELDFVHTLKEFDKDSIEPRIIRALHRYSSDPDFHPNTMRSVSTAATSLCMWVRAMVTYDRVAKSIAPKRAKLASSEADLRAVQAELALKRDSVRKIEARLAELKTRYDGSMTKQADLQRRSQDITVRLERASRLTVGLGSETDRWEAKAVSLKEQLHCLPGDLILASAAVAYLGPFTQAYRQRLLTEWHGFATDQALPVSSRAFSLSSVMGDAMEVRGWARMGLPEDPFSVDNAIIATRGMARRWPLMIDPQGQAKQWVSNLEKASPLCVVNHSDPDMLRAVERCLPTGRPVLLEGVPESPNPALDPLLLRSISKRSGQTFLRIGGTDVAYDPSFRLYLSSSLRNPHFLPDLFVKVAVLNFTLTRAGLEEQLLVEVARRERPQLQERRDKLVLSISVDMGQLEEVEDAILHMLSNAPGDLLAHEDLIHDLSSSKETAEVVARRMAEAEETREQLSEAMQHLRAVAVRGALLYFTVAELPALSPMYTFSLRSFVRLLSQQLRLSEAAEDQDMRVRILTRDITAAVHRHVSRGLFQRHALPFSFSLATAILREEGAISDADWDCFLRRGSSFASGGGEEDPATAVVGGGEAKYSGAGSGSSLPPVREGKEAEHEDGWLTQSVWTAMRQLGQLSPLSGLPDHISRHMDPWGEWARRSIDAATGADASATAALVDPPAPWDERISAFHRLLLLRALRPGALQAGCRALVSGSLGEEFAQPVPLGLEAVLEGSTQHTPLLLLLSPGCDPLDAILRLGAARGRDMTDSGQGLAVVAMGHGQGERAAAALRNAMLNGGWVVLQNCHLTPQWLPTLEHLLSSAEPSRTHAQFRLWLTSKPCTDFPVAILQSCVKVSMDPPRGVRAQLRMVYSQYVREGELTAGAHPLVFRKLLFGVAFFHALCVERRRFGGVGWCVPYQWTAGDLKTGIAQLQAYVEESAGEVPYDTLVEVVGGITYGGRITQRWDRRTARSLLRYCVNADVMEDGREMDPNGQFSTPPSSADGSGGIAAVLAHIASLPATALPEAFGLHPNAAIACDRRRSAELLAAITSMEPEVLPSTATAAAASTSDGGGDGGGDTDGFAAIRASADAILKRLPPPIPVVAAEERLYTSGGGSGGGNSGSDGGDDLSPLSVVCNQECSRMNELLRVVVASLHTLHRALEGKALMTAALQQLQRALLFQRVPAAWAAAAYPSVKPLGSWVDDLVQRADHLRGWLHEGQPPATLWLSALFFPRAFFSALLQSHARQSARNGSGGGGGGVAVDTLWLRPTVLDKEAEEVAQPAPTGAYIHGLFMQGGRWDSASRRICESLPGILWNPLPVIWLEPLVRAGSDSSISAGAANGSPRTADGGVESDGGSLWDVDPSPAAASPSAPGGLASIRYECPVYKTSERRDGGDRGSQLNLITTLSLPCEGLPDHWVRRGTAIICQQDE